MTTETKTKHPLIWHLGNRVNRGRGGVYIQDDNNSSVAYVQDFETAKWIIRVMNHFGTTLDEMEDFVSTEEGAENADGKAKGASA